MKVKVGISNRHIHLNKEDFDLLFPNTVLEKRNDLSQTGEFASNLTVTLEGPKGIIPKVRLVGPLRTYTQVELSKTDCYILGIECPVRTSGDLNNAGVLNIKSDNNNINRMCGIIATRHIHINAERRKEYGLLQDKYKIKIDGIKGGIIDNVVLKEQDNYNFELHLDMDDANAFLLNQGDELEIIEE